MVFIVAASAQQLPAAAISSRYSAWQGLLQGLDRVFAVARCNWYNSNSAAVQKQGQQQKQPV
jgi:hypothetical protein